MGKEEKLAHLMEGFVENLYQAIFLKEVSSTEEFIKHLLYIEEMNQTRLGRQKFERLPNVVPIATFAT